MCIAVCEDEQVSAEGILDVLFPLHKQHFYDTT